MMQQEDSPDTQELVDFGDDAGGGSHYHHVMIDNLNDEVILDDAEESKQA